MRLAFVAWTPLHLINIINVYHNFYHEAQGDLFIYSEFENAEAYSRRIDELGIFDKVVLVDYKKMGSFIERKLNLITNHNPFFSDNLSRYDEIFLQGENYFSKILFSKLHKNNPDIKMNYIEDGLGTYLNNKVFTTSKNIQKFFALINKHSIFKKKFNSYFVYCPELLLYNVEKVTRIPKIKEESDLMGIFSTIFGVEKIFIRNKCLFFDQPLLKDGYGVDETQIFEKIKEILPKKKEILVKLHPRVEINRYGQNQLLNSALPFEVLLAENDFSNSLIISPISTISFSPSMMFEKKVHSILLAKLIINEFSTLPNEKKEILENIVLFCQKYNEVSEMKILLPANWDQLRKLVE